MIAHKADYYRLLLNVMRDGAWEPWLLFMLQAVADTSKWTAGKIAAIRGLAEHTTEYVRTRLPKIYTREVVDVIFEQPYCRIGNLVDKGTKELPNDRPLRATCTTWPAWVCCAKCRLARKSSSYTRS